MTKMEIEAKYQVPCENLSIVKEKILSLGGRCFVKQEETDIYYIHPCRNFHETDEALRIRLVNGKIESLTYKGPRKKEDLKIREELIVKLEDDNIMHILDRLGFSPAVIIKKNREYCKLGNSLITIDTVENLGCFIEIEAVDSNPDTVTYIAESLDLKGEPIVKSYVELLLEKTH